MEIFSNVTSVNKDTYNPTNIEKEHHPDKIENSESITKSNQEIEKEQKKNEEKITKEKLQELTAKLNKEMEPLNPDIKFHFNEKIDDLVVNVIDKKTDKIIRKIPSDEAIKIMEKMRELVGALFDKKG